MLSSLLRSHDQSRSRESIFRLRFLYDVKLAAAKVGYDLKVYDADVDNEGSDVVLSEDGDILKKIQLKTVLFGAKTKVFKIHNDILLPNQFYAQDLRISKDICGSQGCVVLQILHVNSDQVEVEYRVLDAFILAGLKWKIFRITPEVKETTIEGLLLSMSHGSPHDKSTVPKSLFVKARGTDHLLALLGFTPSRDLFTVGEAPTYTLCKAIKLTYEAKSEATDVIALKNKAADWYRLLSDMVK
ncbi:MAG: hypothetical protein HYV97_18800 [Bdellovibrio sp.]|nr:hypothetical protein [Bdellovibrio sp.]